jgi:cytochrome c oxidase cbb3-type subunit III
VSTTQEGMTSKMGEKIGEHIDETGEYEIIRRKRAALLDHEYDGIREYDNPTPGWWHGIFLASVVFSVFYVAFFHVSPMSWTIHEQWTRKQNVETKKLFGTLALQPTQQDILKMQADARMMAVGRGMFESNCAACHAKDGGGINGFNLCDNNYKSVAKLEDIYTVITKGANNGAMPPWETRLNQNERVLVSAYVASLRGTTPAAPRSADGVEIPPFPQPTK